MTAVILQVLLAFPFDPPFSVTADGQVIDLPEGARPTYANSFPWFGDLDGDGKPDLLIGQSRSGKERGGRLRVYRNTGKPGAPRFGAFAWFDESVPTGHIPDGWNPGVFTPQLADYDGDGRIDLLSGSTCCQDPWCIYLFRRQADGTFGPREAVVLDFPEKEFDGFEFSSNGLRSRPAVADWNGDGHPDLLVTGGPPAVAYGPLRTDKVTMKRLWPKAARDELNPLAPHVSTNPVLADWDGDGLLDVIGGARLDEAGKPKLTSEPGVYWWRNVGTKKEPKLGPPRVLIRETNAACATGVAVADWDADGKPDLIVAREERNGAAQNWSTRYHKVWVYRRR